MCSRSKPPPADKRPWFGLFLLVLTMCDGHDDGIDPEITRRARARGHQAGGLFTALLLLRTLCDSGGGDRGPGRPSDDQVREVVRRQGKSLRDYIDSHQRRNGDPHRFTLLAPLRALARIGGTS